jgi:long-chain acyl-CoA synthetase
MLPYRHTEAGDKPAMIMAGSGETVPYSSLEARSNQIAHLFRSIGIRAGDAISILVENSPRFFELVMAAHRSGLRYTCMSTKLATGEISYIVKDSGSKALIASHGLAALAEAAAAQVEGVALFMVGGVSGAFKSLEDAIATQPTTRLADESLGDAMLYSSGTTGHPKGVRRAAVDRTLDDLPALSNIGMGLYGFSRDMVYLSPAPLYHAAPLGWSMAVLELGGTVVIMEHFEAEAALGDIARYKVTHAQWVPTHFVRMLKLPDATRAKYDVSSLKAVYHAAAPCPVPVKEAMIAWWGPIIHEYYAGTEGNGFVACNSQEWLAHKGTVGKALNCEIKICDEAGDPVPPRAEGEVFFAGGGQFEYHNDPDKTAKSRNKHGWSTLGDIGWLDEDGFLYLTDRKSFMIISGGVNIYPQEVENLLVTHPKVADVAVIGAPHEEMGEQVVAVIQPAEWSEAGDDLAAELLAFCRAHISHVKCPRKIDFRQELPRHQTGKLYKRLIRDEYWGKAKA